MFRAGVPDFWKPGVVADAEGVWGWGNHDGNLGKLALVRK
jgi:hypothetical protein